MPWVRLDDKFWRNPKMRRLSHAARGVHVDAMSYCADTAEPTGFLSMQEAADRACGPARSKLIGELVTVGAWEPLKDGYLLHDYDKYLERGSRERCRQWREKKRDEGVTRTVREPFVNRSDSSPRATGLETISKSGLLPGPEPGPDGDGVKPAKRLEMPQRNFRGGAMTSLSESLPKLVVS